MAAHFYNLPRAADVCGRNYYLTDGIIHFIYLRAGRERIVDIMGRNLSHLTRYPDCVCSHLHIFRNTTPLSSIR